MDICLYIQSMIPDTIHFSILSVKQVISPIKIHSTNFPSLINGGRDEA